MQQVKLTQRKLYPILVIVIATILLAACSDNSSVQSTVENQEVATIEIEEGTNEVQEETLPKGSITFDEFINRWNEIEPERLSRETETISVENGIKTDMGHLGIPDSYIVQYNQKDSLIKTVSLNLSFPLPEDGGGLWGNIPYNVGILMDVLEPELKEEDKEELLNTLLNSRMIPEVSARWGNVTYTVENGDDRFWLDATFSQY
ncbi:hypothetical protein M3181_21995 [Mesobacillus maritimus]|uniref:hypothetical protein n=1 Tax=Mesobacillus maritimus TaxID=1643336 RepID=UPI00204033BF|nr:hypothetical protein [Mesobacillus maritimus]MCM3671632.1 hypothetical protein [Mesobacillus maritimus]